MFTCLVITTSGMTSHTLGAPVSPSWPRGETMIMMIVTMIARIMTIKVIMMSILTIVLMTMTNKD